MSDPPAQFRREQPAAAHQPKTGKKTYEAYDKSGRPCPYTAILCVSQPSQSPQARFFLVAVFSVDFDEAFTLLYSFMAVEIKGKHMKEVRQAVQIGRCESIREYDENAFLPPAKNTPVIESVRFIAGEKLEDILRGTAMFDFERKKSMYARITRITWPQGKKVEGMDEVIQAVRDQIVPLARQLQGFKGFLGLSRDGEIILHSLWETEADLQATEVHQFDDFVKDKLGFWLNLNSTPLWLQDYEVFTSDRR